MVKTFVNFEFKYTDGPRPIECIDMNVAEHM
jgi:hypothetical protein